MIDALRAWLQVTSALEIIAVVLGFVYVLLAVRRSRWCFLAGGIGSAILIYLSLYARLPMQAVLQVYYIGMSVYGFQHWSKQRIGSGGRVGTWPVRLHLGACAGIVLVSVISGRLLTLGTPDAWPYLDSLATWGSLFATWLVARAKLENWLYWIAIDSLQAFLFAAQGLYFIVLLHLVYVGISVAGFLAWLKTYRTHLQAPAQAG